ncbi:putative ABC-type phosphate transporter [Helianthus annuus]|nr:putative ABC-type phosphate transporter [Helianthus annuus]
MDRFAIQLMGFFFMTIFMFVLAIPYHHRTKDENPEIFSARLHSTCHGISATAGKAAATVGAYGFLYASESTYPKKTDASYPTSIGIRYILIILAVVHALGLSFTFLVPEPNGQSFKEMSGENEEEREL